LGNVTTSSDTAIKTMQLPCAQVLAARQLIPHPRLRYDIDADPHFRRRDTE
jgi:hypothetical protein